MTLFKRTQTCFETGKKYVRIVKFKEDEILLDKSFNIDEITEEGVANILKETGIMDKQNIIQIIPAHMLYMRVIKLPIKARERIEEIVELEFVSKFPYSYEEIIYSYYIVDLDEEGII